MDIVKIKLNHNNFMIILVINCGSSSIKYQLLDMKSDDVFDVIAKGICRKNRPSCRHSSVCSHRG